MCSHRDPADHSQAQLLFTFEKLSNGELGMEYRAFKVHSALLTLHHATSRQSGLEEAKMPMT